MATRLPASQRTREELSALIEGPSFPQPPPCFLTSQRSQRSGYRGQVSTIRPRSMKVAALAALSVLIALPAEAGQARLAK